jgi:hypothetical protein
MAEGRGGQFGNSVLDAFVAHEGSHVVDDLKLIRNGYREKDNVTHLTTEQRAYSLENKVIELETMRTNPEWQSKEAIKKFLLSQPELYPNLQSPILEPNATPIKVKK